MTKIVHKNLPNAVSVSDVTDTTVRQKLMLANQNIAVLMSQLAEAQKAIVELQRKTGMSVTLGGSTAEVKTVVNATLQEKGIQDGAEPNVQSDWAQTDTTADDYIKNKPTIPGPTTQVNSDWNATEGVAKILNKPTTMKNPYAVSLTPINASGSSGEVVQYDGSVAKSLNVVTAHQDISGKINYPSGGSDDNVLMKSGTGVKWGVVSSSGGVYAKSFSYTTPGNVTGDSLSTQSVDVSESGYTPIAVCGITCYGSEAAYWPAYRAAFSCTGVSISSNTVTLSITMVSGSGTQAMPVLVNFFVLYSKS